MTQVYELFLALVFSLLYIIILESCGDLVLKLVGLILRKNYKKIEYISTPKNSYKTSLILRILTGMLILGMVYFVLGIAGQFHKETLILAAVIFPIFKYGFILGEYIIKSVNGVKAESKLSPITSIYNQLNIDYNGEFVRYSVHPYLNFFWNSFFLSTPLSPAIQGLAINLFQWILIILSMYFAFITISKINKIPNWLLILGPSLLGIVNNVTNAYGAGYNDIYGIAIILFLVPFLYKLQTQEKIWLEEIVWAMMGIVCLALLKVFFALFSALIFVYLLWIVYDKKGFNFKKDQRFWLSILGVSLSFGLIFIIPWVIR